MRAKGHAAIGSITGMVVGLAGSSFDPDGGPITVAPDPWLTELLGFRLTGFPLAILYVAAAMAIATLTASWPDLLEPAKKYGSNHRGFWHSWTMLAALVGVNLLIAQGFWSLGHNLRWLIVYPAIWGYISHLAVDLATPRRLPLLRRRR